MAKSQTRCAIYTRKSSEEGLEQSFNSLHAQREACEAFILSQRHEGWSALRTLYDDGGFSGGTMERPALQRLLAEIKDGRIDVVVVYKIDRLTRSLFDFAKIVEIFDAHSVSFVSVTQSFNTTTSMGRLTLNVLLSFAQFEREVTGERIRDKVAASKKKGMWMGGNLPLGYDVRDRKLVVNEAEAVTVRTVFALYDRLGSVRALKEELDCLGLRSKTRLENGKRVGGGPFSRGHLYTLLANPIYIGQIRHKKEAYPGQHAPIIDAALWQRVQDRLRGNCVERRNGARAKEPSLLAGKLFDAKGNRLTPSHAVKAGRRYRYYVSAALVTKARQAVGNGARLPAHELESVVLAAVARFLRQPSIIIERTGIGQDPARINHVLRAAEELACELTGDAPRRVIELLQMLIEQVEYLGDTIRIRINHTGLSTALGCAPASNTDAQRDLKANERDHDIVVPIVIRKRSNELKLVIEDGAPRSGEPNPTLIQALVQAHLWWRQFQSGGARTPADIAREESISRSHISRMLRLAFLAPDITEAILAGTQPPELTLRRLLKAVPLPLHWHEQRRVLQFTAHPSLPNGDRPHIGR